VGDELRVDRIGDACAMRTARSIARRACEGSITVVTSSLATSLNSE